MKEFQKLVDDAAKESLDLVINNASYAHAEVLFKKIVSNANNTLSLLTGRCNCNFYKIPGILEAFSSFAKNKKGKLKIIFEEGLSKEDIKNNILVTKLKESYDEQENFMVYQLKNNDNITTPDKDRFHMLIADTNGPYRFETHHLKDDSETYDGRDLKDRVTDAIANFGDSGKSELLSNFFDKQIKENSTRIFLN